MAESALLLEVEAKLTVEPISEYPVAWLCALNVQRLNLLLHDQHVENLGSDDGSLLD